MDDKELSKIDRWLDNLAAEVVLAEPETDQGLLPCRELFSNLRNKTENEESLRHFHAAAADSVTKIEYILDHGALFSAADLEMLKQRIALLKQLRANPDKPFVPEGEATPAAATDTTQAQPAPVETAAPAPAPVAAPEPVFEAMPLVLDPNTELDLLKEFFTESQEHLENIEQGALILEDNPQHKETLDSIFRAFHSFKGAAGFLNLKPMNRLAHELESLLDLIREGKRHLNATLIDVILKGGDMLREYVVELQEQAEDRSPRQPIIKPVAKLIHYVRGLIESKEGEVVDTPVAAATPAIAPEPAPAGVKVLSSEQTAAPVSEVATLAPQTEEHTPTPIPSPVAAAAPAPISPPPTVVEKPRIVPIVKAPEAETHATKTSNAVVKVDTQKLDSLVDLVGEMVITQSMVAQDPDLRSLDCPRLSRNMAQLGRIVNDLQRTAMSMRMVPIRATFQKMNRLVRDLTAKLNKQIELKLSGEDTELDRTIIEEIGDPLIHMVRNSIDHGIEMPDARIAAGKPATGILHLNAFHQGGNIVIQISDDGAGLNEERIVKKAIEKGLISEKQQLTRNEIFGLIFAPGFSTAETVSDLSGRGVGMDVVRSNIEKLRGKVAIDSTPGKGAVFTIYLPLTLAIIDGLIVSVGDQHYILPTLSVKESFRPKPDMISTVHERGEMVNVRGHLCPLLRLRDLFGIKSDTDNPDAGIIIVIESGNMQRCLMVDDLVGKQEIVIKSLGDSFKSNRSLSGASILGDGRVGLILDISSLVNLRETRTDVTPMAA